MLEQKDSMNSFKHSGTFGDLIYALPIVKHLGGGEFYLHLDQINWIGSYYYGSAPNPFHQGRMNSKDFDFMQSFMTSQEYIKKFDVMRSDTEITHNLDRFRPLFLGHPGNYVDIYSHTFNIFDTDTKNKLRNSTWLTVDSEDTVKGRPVVINRSARWQPRQLSPQWKEWQKTGLMDQAIFVGMEEEYQAFKKTTGWDLPFHYTNTMMDLAKIIAGSEMFIGNQSMALSLAIGLGVNVHCEHRDDLPLERNECYGFNPQKVKYFGG